MENSYDKNIVDKNNKKLAVKGVFENDSPGQRCQDCSKLKQRRYSKIVKLIFESDRYETVNHIIIEHSKLA